MNYLLRYQSALLYAILVCITAALYWPGLNGGFILDDFPNLNLLALLPENGSLIQILNLSTNGIASDVGRPLSMFSFLLQAEAWPNSPYQFKLVNLFIHLTNGVLVALLFRQLAIINRQLHISPALLVIFAAIWLLHPIHVSTVLYVVQRMNLLASLFVLSGLVTYLWSRNCYDKTLQLRYLLLMTVAPFVFAVLGLLCKESGVLLYVYLFVLEMTLLSSSPQSAKLQQARKLAVFVPLVSGVVVFLILLPGMLEAYQQKPFTLGERSLTQFPVLLSYIASLLLPYSDRFGLFHDTYPLHSAMPPIIAYGSMLLIVALVAAAIHRRKTSVLFAFCTLWFFAGHILESSLLPLELYFEHRNYLPSIGLAFGLALAVNKLKDFPGRRQKVIASVTTLALLCWLGLLTMIEASIWGNNLSQATTEVNRRPSSYRAQVHLVQTITEAGEPQRGFNLHQQFMAQRSPKIFDYIRWLEFACILEDIALPEDDAIQSTASSALIDYSAVGQLNRVIPAVLNGACPQLLLPKLIITIEALLQNENFTISWPDLLFARATIFYAAGEIQQATQLTAQSFTMRPDIPLGLSHLRWLLESDEQEQVREFLRIYEQEFEFEISTREGLSSQLSQIREQLD